MPKIIIKTIEDKTWESYKFVREGRAGNPSLHKKNYPSRAVLVVDNAKLEDLRQEKEEAVQWLLQELKKRGIRGEIIVQYAAGGLGKKRPEETRESWLARRQEYGMPTLFRRRL